MAVTLQMMALFGPLQSVLHVAAVSIGDLFVTGIISFATLIIVVEIHKFIGRHFYHSPNMIK